MNDAEVLIHELDNDAGVYRLVVGAPEYADVTSNVQVGEEEHPDASTLRDQAAAIRAEADQMRAEIKAMRAERGGEDEPDLAPDPPMPTDGMEDRAVALETEAAALPKVPVFEERTERAVVDVPVFEDFVFAADDERWQGKTPDQIAKAQRKIVAAALAERAQAAEEALERDVQELPGVGEQLA